MGRHLTAAEVERAQAVPVVGCTCRLQQRGPLHYEHAGALCPVCVSWSARLQQAAVQARPSEQAIRRRAA